MANLPVCTVMKPPLIAPLPYLEFTAEQYHEYVQGMYALRTKGRAKPAAPAPGLTVKRTSKGELSVCRTKKKRAFAYVTFPEIAALAKATGTAQSDLWNMFKRKEYIIAKDRMAAEQAYAELKGVTL